MERKLFISLGILLFGIISSNISSNNILVNKQIRKAAGDEHKLIFKGDARGVGNYALSNAGWWGVDSCTFANSTVTIPNGSTSYFSNGSIKANETYVISYDLKTNGDASFQFNLNTPEWKNFQKGTFNNSDYVHYDFIYTATADNNNMTFYFQVTGGVEIYVQNLYVYSTTSISVTEGQAIGTLPEVASIEGKKGYWTIDDTKITNESIYNYSVDKVVHAKYEDVCSITYHNGGAVDFASDTKYWKSGTNLVKEDNVLHMKNEDNLADQPIHTYDVSDSSFTMLEKGKKYKLVFDIKCDNLYLRIANCSPWEVLLGGWTNHAEFTKKELTFEASSSGVATIRFRVDTTGNMFIKNLRLYEISTIEYSKNQPLGTLPIINVQGKYSVGTWTIDGQDITSATIFNYETLNKEAYVKYLEKYTLTYYGAEDIYTTNLAKNINYWTKQGNVDLSKSYDEDSLVFKGEKSAMIRYCEPSVFKLIEGDTYVVKGKIKTGDSKIHLVINNDWANTILLTHYQAKEYQEINIEFIAPKNDGANSFIDFQFASASGEKQFSIKDFYITHITKSDYFANDSLSNLPNFPQGSGWIIDNVLINKETKYNFKDDKIAYLAPIISYNGKENITYRIGREITIEGLDIKSFYAGESSYKYTWYNTNNEVVNELTQPGSYKLSVRAVEINGGISLNEVKINVNVLERDSIAPNWTRDGETYIYPEELNLTVHAGWYAQLNLEALDDIDGIIEVTYDFNGLVDEFNRFVVGKGNVTCIAKDFSGNQIQIIIHLVVVE